MAALSPTLLIVRDESHKHAGHGDFVGEGGTHFHITIACPAFEGLSLVNRHRLVYDALQEEIAGGVHALAIEARAS